MFAAATPKQIKELMKVDGLTNDEVKSHLQVKMWSFFRLEYLHGLNLCISEIPVAQQTAGLCRSESEQGRCPSAAVCRCGRDMGSATGAAGGGSLRLAGGDKGLCAEAQVSEQSATARRGAQRGKWRGRLRRVAGDVHFVPCDSHLAGGVMSPVIEHITNSDVIIYFYISESMRIATILSVGCLQDFYFVIKRG